VLFNSYQFILVFLPITAGGYFLICRSAYARHAMLWLAAASLVFYSVWNPVYLPLILGSIILNFAVSRVIHANGDMQRVAKRLLIVGITANLVLLGYFKYADFFIVNVNSAFGTHIALLHVVLPLGISFFYLYPDRVSGGHLSTTRISARLCQLRSVRELFSPSARRTDTASQRDDAAV